MANVFETGLALAVVQLDFLTEVMETIKRQGRKDFDRVRYEADFDAFIDRQHAQTLGNLIKRAQGLVDMDVSLKDLIAEAKKRRDFVADHFFRERSEEFASRRGRDKMIVELESAHALFEAVDHALGTFTEPYRNQLGMSDEIINAHTAKYLQSLAGDGISSRLALFRRLDINELPRILRRRFRQQSRDVVNKTRCFCCRVAAFRAFLSERFRLRSRPSRRSSCIKGECSR